MQVKNKSPPWFLTKSKLIKNQGGNNEKRI